MAITKVHNAVNCETSEFTLEV